MVCPLSCRMGDRQMEVKSFGWKMHQKADRCATIFAPYQPWGCWYLSQVPVRSNQRNSMQVEGRSHLFCCGARLERYQDITAICDIHAVDLSSGLETIVRYDARKDLSHTHLVPIPYALQLVAPSSLQKKLLRSVVKLHACPWRTTPRDTAVETATSSAASTVWTISTRGI